MTSFTAASRMNLVALAFAAALALPTPALAQSSSLLSGRNIGAVGGAVAGGVAGKQIVGKKNRTLGIAAGAVGGGVLGAVAGNMYDKSQKPKAAKDPLTTGSVGKSNLLSGQNVGIA
ncbi:MAG: glycine zipper 2TM domain-containing protein, partial [Beijerinckiaceae bacterium]